MYNELTDANFFASYTMIANYNGDGFAQIGYEHDPGLPLRTFTEFAQSTINVQAPLYYASVSAGSVIQYWEQYDALCACIHVNKGTTRVADSYFNPIGYWSSSLPWWPQISQELGFTQSDTAGTAGAPNSFDNLQFQGYYTNAFTPAPCDLFWTDDYPTLPRHWSASHPSCDKYYLFNQ